MSTRRFTPRLPLLGLALASALGLGAARAFQDPPAPPTDEDPLPPGVAAIVDGRVITVEEYKDFLLRLYGRRPLRELIALRLLEMRAEAAGLGLAEEELEAEVEKAWGNFASRFGSDRKRLERELENLGHSPASFRLQLREQSRRSLLARRIARAERVVTEEMVHQRFEREYGPDGIREDVRHVFLTRGRMKLELQRAGADPAELTLEVLDRNLEERARTILAELAAGAAFEDLARRYSHDLSVTRTGGAIPDYDYLRFGPELAVAVRAAEVGAPTGPVRSGTGLHVIEVTRRTRTAFEEVREEVHRRLVEEDASFAEITALERRLYESADIRQF